MTLGFIIDGFYLIFSEDGKGLSCVELTLAEFGIGGLASGTHECVDSRLILGSI